jgi:hypothetical protein
MDLALAALRKVNFDWTAHIEEIWVDQAHETAGIQTEARNALIEHLEDLVDSPKGASPLGIPILGPAGSGKTHLLGFLRREALTREAYFILVDMTDVSDFWETVSLGYLRSLQHQLSDGRRQVDRWLDRMIKLYGQSLRKPEDIPKQRPPALINRADELIHQIREKHRAEVQEHADVLRALIFFACDHSEINDLGYKWLQGMTIDDEELRLGFRQTHQSTSRIVRGLSWLLSLTGPTVLALDQLDAIVAEHELSRSDAADEQASEQQKRSLAIIQGIAGGLLDLRDVTRRTLSIVSSLETTWVILDRQAPVSMADRFNDKLLLKLNASPDVLGQLVEKRLKSAYEAVGFQPPYPSFPYAGGFFEKYRDNTPRELLKACEAHRRACRAAGVVTATDEATPIRRDPDPGWPETIDARLKTLLLEVNPALVLHDEDEKLQDEFIEAACDAIVLENPAPESVAVKIDRDFMGTGNYAPLHARIRLILTENREREVHFAFRFLEKSHHSAFQSRLKAAMTASGIDKNLGFRGLTILRQGPIPSGPATARVVAELAARGGTLVSPSNAELATVLAVQGLIKTAKDTDRIEEWLTLRRPVSKLACFKPAILALSKGLTDPSPESVARLHANTPPSTPEIAVEARRPSQFSPNPSPPSQVPVAATRPTVISAPPPSPTANAKFLPVGHRQSGGLNEPIGIALDQLPYHTCVFAGSGSGKTVFLKRVIEEAALLGIPSIVLDGANDLSRLGAAWDQEPPEFNDEDRAKAKLYRERAEVIVWTPGASNGNPMRLNPLPEFTLVGSTPEERAAELDLAIEIATTSVGDMIIKQGGASAPKQLNILKSTLRHFARRPGTIRDLVDLLREPPDDVVDPYEKGSKLARELSELLHAQIGNDPLVGGAGTPLDPTVLFRGKDPKKTRISVLSLVGLPSYDQKRRFVDQLAGTLFSWIKKNPAPPGGLLGLLVIDEAKDFVPSGKSVPGRENVLRLAAQARKYGLGLLFATQEPKSIDNKVVSNCSTLLGGKVSSPAAIDALQQLLSDKGTRATDVGALPRGTFYFGSGTEKPRKITTSLCLSWHPSTPPSETEVLDAARKSRAFV